MKKLLQIICFFLFLNLAGCATKIVSDRYDSNSFAIHQHFSNSSISDANNLAMNYCATRNATPRLVRQEAGCMLACGTEFNEYSYQCVSNQSIAEDRQTFDTNSCIGWGFVRGTEGFANCMLRLYEVRIAVDNAATTNREIRSMSEQQRRIAEKEQAFKLLNLSNQMLQQNRPQQITPFSCIRNGIFVNCQ